MSMRLKARPLSRAMAAGPLARAGLSPATFGSRGVLPVLPSDGNDSYTTVLLHMDGTDAATTFTDSNAGGSAHTWTAAGNAQIDTAEKKFGSASGLFDGTGDWISTPDHADWTMGSGAFTIDFWFRRAGGDGSYRGLIGNNDNLGQYGFMIRLNSSDQLEGWFTITTEESLTSTSTFTGTDWVHAAFVRTGDTLKMFVNGTQEGGDNACSGSMTDVANALYVARQGSTGNGWNGWIDEVRISKGIARWTGNFTPPIAAYSP
jgi:hypothetical protein